MWWMYCPPHAKMRVANRKLRWQACPFQQGGRMLRCNNQLRLHKDDAERLLKFTGTYPIGIKNVDDLNKFIDCQLEQLENCTTESKLLRLLLEDEKCNEK
jgi:hypothetical protein